MHRYNSQNWLGGCRYVGALLLAVIALSMQARAADDPPVTLTFEPQSIVVGGEAWAVLRSTRGRPRLEALPETPGLVWTQSTRMGRQIINGRGLWETAYALEAQDAGELEIPPIAVVVGNERFVLPGQTLIVGEDNRFELSVTYGGKTKPPARLYADQELPIEIKLTIPNDDNTRISRDFFRNPDLLFPHLDLQNASTRGYLDADSGATFPFGYAIREEGDQIVIRYQGGIWPNGTGPLSGELTQHVPQISSSHNGMMRFSRVVYRKLTHTIPTIPVQPLPPPADSSAANLGLVGDWELELAFNHGSARLGEDLELTLTAAGHGNLDAAVAPTLDLPGFTVYDPEISRAAGETDRLEVRWVVVPVDADARVPTQRLQTFDPVAGEYRVASFTPELVLLDSNGQVLNAPAPPAVPETTASDSQAVAASEPANAGWRPPKAPGASMGGPTSGTIVGLAVVLLLAGPLGFLLAARRVQHARRLAADPSFQRRQAAKGRSRQVLTEFERASDSELPDLVRERLLPWLIDLHALPPGLTVEELADRLDDEQLGQRLRDAAHAAYRPAGVGGIDRDGLLAGLKRLLVLVLLIGLGATTANAQEPNLGQSIGHTESYEEAVEAFPRDATAWYNLGCAYAAADELGPALGAFERARRLAPRSTDLRANLDLTRSRLGLPTSASVAGGPLQELRDHLTPGEWQGVAAIFWCLAWLIAGIGLRRRRAWLVSALMMGLTIGCVLAAEAQRRETWRPGSAIAIQDGSLRDLPGADEETDGFQRVAMGKALQVLEDRGDFLRVQSGSSTGWLPSDHIQVLAP